MGSNLSSKAEQNFEYMRGVYQDTLNHENSNELHIYDYLSLSASILLGISALDLIDVSSDSEKFILMLYLLSLSAVLGIGFYGRLQIYNFWKQCKKFDLENVNNWNKTSSEISSAKDEQEAKLIYSGAKSTEASISLLKRTSTSDGMIYAQAFFMMVSLVSLIILFTVKLW